MNISYNLDFLKEIIKRDGAELLEQPIKLIYDSKPKFKCGDCKIAIVDYKKFTDMNKHCCICKDCGKRKLKEKTTQILIDNNKKRGQDKKKEWEIIEKKNKMNCRTCLIEKTLDLFSTRANEEYNMWVTECRDCENKRKNEVAKKRAITKGLEWNVNQINTNDNKYGISNLLRCS